MTAFRLVKDDRTTAFRIIKELSFREGKFTLASGKESNFYLDMKPTMLHPEGVTALANMLLDTVSPLEPAFIGGLEMGAVPLIAPITMLSFGRSKPIPGFFVRQKIKTHGTKKLIEGVKDEDMKGKAVVILDDVTTTGGSAMEAVTAVQNAGARVVLVLSIVDREEGAVSFYKERGIPFASLFRVSEFMSAR